MLRLTQCDRFFAFLAHWFASIEDALPCKAQGEDTKVQFVAGWAILYAL